MTLSPGTDFAHYRVVSPLGVGGMGEVYRATDTRLGRDVALKVLPEEFTQDKERLARFEREAQLLAQLQHPNIASIYGLEESDGTRALVMELVEGPTLAERLEQGAIPPSEFLAIAKQIAEALEEAHEKGIVHRDLKPQNVKASIEGRVKVLDFGLAKAMDPVGVASGADSASQLAASPTLTLGATQMGVILGTAAYMAPEQAKGLAVDKRADVWAFGVVLYEMLVGESLFGGDTVTETLADVLRNPIDLESLPDATPAPVRRVLARCLERDPKRRLRDIGEARIALEDAGAPDAGGEPASSRAAGRSAPSRRGTLPWLAAALALAVACVALGLAWRSAASSKAAPPEQTALGIQLPAGFVLAGDEAPVVDVSRDGRTVVFEASGPSGRQLFLRRLDRVGATPIAGTEDAVQPFLSPDGRWVGFYSGGRIRKVPIEGGTPIEIASVNAYRGATWCDDGWIVFTSGYSDGLVRVREAGGAHETVTELDTTRRERTHRWPGQIPGTPWVFYTVGVSNSPSFYDDARIDAVRLDTGERRTLFEGAWMARFAPPSTLLLQRRSSLVALALDPERATVRGREQLALEGVGGEASSGAGYFAAGAGGVVAFVPAEALSNEKTIALVDLDGGETLLPLPERNYWYPRFSPDGGRLALDIGSGQGTDDDVWLYDLEEERLSRFTLKPASLLPIWSPDGRWIVFGGATGGRDATLFRKRVDGVGDEEVVWKGSDVTLPTAWAPDGRSIAATDSATEIESFLVDVEAGEARPLAEAPGLQWGVHFSPDGRFMAYTTNETGSNEIFVSTVSEGSSKWQVSAEGGEQPTWSRDGRHIYYVHEDAIWQVAIETADGFRAGTPREVVRGAYQLRTAPFRNYDVGPGDRFVFVRRRTDVVAARQLEVLVGWTPPNAIDR